MSIVGSEQWMYSSGREFYDFPIEQSLRFEDGDSAYLSRTPASAGNQTTYTLSMWFKYGNIKDMMLFGAGSSTSNQTYIRLYGGANQAILWETDTGATTDWYVRTNALLRDPSAWYHLVFVFDNSLSGITNKAKIYINGEIASIAASSGDYPSGYVNAAVPHYIGRSASTTYTDGYMADVNFIDGQALDPTSFGEFKSGIWIPKDTAGLTFGTNGFRLQFDDTTEASGFNAVTWTGNGSSQSISGVGFSSAPDLVWTKKRSSTSAHYLVDSVRGSDKVLFGNLTDAEVTTSNVISSLDSDGFSIGSDGGINASGQTFVGWAWDAGSGSAASNTDGSITSTVKANTDYGFSITSYTGNGSAGATVGHSLGVQPDMIIVKSRDNARDWRVYHSSLGAIYALDLNTTLAVQGPSSAYWNSTEPTSSVFSIGSVTTVNGSGEDYIAYCFAEKTGYSKFGTYSGTGAAGNSITTGFKPAFVMVKRTDVANSWYMFDNTRNASGQTVESWVIADGSNAEADNTFGTFDSNGFTVNGTSGGWNLSGGTYIYMAFADTRDAAFWRDTSGEGNDWQPNNLVFSDVVPDSTTNNFAVVPSTTLPSTGYSQHTEGNLQLYQPSWGGWDINLANFNLPSSGKYYWEVMPVQGIFNAGYGAFVFGIGNIRGRENISGFPTFGNPLIQVDSRGIGEYRQYPSWVNYTTSGSFGFTVGSTVYGIAVDCDNKKFWFSLNNSWAGTSGTTLTAGTGDPANGTNGDPISGDMTDYVPFFNLGDQQSSCRLGINFGQDSTFAGARAAGGNADENGLGDFAYAPPSGFLSLCSANLPTGAIDTLNDETPEDYFNTKTYQGNGVNTANSNNITGIGFQPDLMWIKARSSAQNNHIQDTVAGLGYFRQSNTTNADQATGGGDISSVTSDGFYLSYANSRTNGSGIDYAAWNWKAGGTGVSNTDGSITSTVSVSETSQGVGWFSVVGFTTQSGGYTVGHGLGQKPSLIITKNRDTAGGAWYTFTDIIDGSVDYLALNQTSAKLNDPFGLANPTSSVFSLDDDYIFGSGDCIAYCFANAEGLCKTGSYVGNGNTGDGTFVYTGFRPSFVMWKRTDTTSDWFMMDVKRDIDNPTDHKLEANTSGAEVVNTAYHTDYLSNGFKLRNSNGQLNASGGNYIYIAIAEQPFKYANAR